MSTSLIKIPMVNKLIPLIENRIFFSKMGSNKKNHLVVCKKTAYEIKRKNRRQYNPLFKVDGNKLEENKQVLISLIFKGNCEQLDELLAKYPLPCNLIIKFTDENYLLYFLLDNCPQSNSMAITEKLASQHKHLIAQSSSYLPIPDFKYWHNGKSSKVEVISTARQPYLANYFIIMNCLKIWLPLENIENDNVKRTNLPLESLPNFFKEFVEASARSIGCPVDNIVIPALTVIASLIHHKLHIAPTENQNYLVAINLWSTIVMPPGSKKSPPVHYILRFLNDLEKLAASTFEESKKEIEPKKKQVKITNKLFEASAKSCLKDSIEFPPESPERKQLELEANEFLKQIINELSSPVLKRLTVSDFTPAAFIKLVQEHPNGFLLYLDELYALFKKIQLSGNEGVKGYLLQLFDSFGVFDKSIKSEEYKEAKDRTVSILGTTQPDKLKPMLKKVLMGSEENDGFFNRIQLLVFVLPLAKKTLLKPMNKVLEKRFQKFISKLNIFNFGFEDDDPWRERVVTFSTNAQTTYDSWFSELLIEIEQLEQTQKSGVLVSQLRKYDSLVPKLACIFQTLSNFERNDDELKPFIEIYSKHVKQAIAFSNYLKSHAKYIFSQELNITAENALTIAKHLHSFESDSFTTNAIYNREWSGMGRDKSLIQDALRYLEKKNWIRLISKKSNSERWQINPHVFEK
jgi:hypothetical protein